MRVLASVLVAAVAGSFGAPSALADIYTWTDKSGALNVSNLPPPDDVKVTKVEKSPPKDPAGEAARQSELRALNERLAQIQDQLDRAQQAPPMAYPPPPALMMPAAYAPQQGPYIVNVVMPQQPAPTYGAAGGCDYTWGDCSFGAWPGYFVYPTAYWDGGGRGKNPGRRSNPPPQNNWQIVPPLIPMPPGFGGRMR